MKKLFLTLLFLFLSIPVFAGTASIEDPHWIGIQTAGEQLLIGKNIDIIFFNGQTFGGKVIKYTAFDIEIQAGHTTYIIPHSSVKFYRIRKEQ